MKFNNEKDPSKIRKKVRGYPRTWVRRIATSLAATSELRTHFARKHALNISAADENPTKLELNYFENTYK